MTDRICACCESELCDQDDWCLNSDDDPVCESCVCCELAEGLLWLPDLPSRTSEELERKEAA
jgi:hypothetical protein